MNCRLSLAVSRVPVSVAVGMPIARHPPHRPVLARLTHTVLTLEAAAKMRQTAAKEGESRLRNLRQLADSVQLTTRLAPENRSRTGNPEESWAK